MNNRKIDFKIALMSHTKSAHAFLLIDKLWKQFVKSKMWLHTHKNTSEELKKFEQYEYNISSYLRFLKDVDESRKDRKKLSIFEELKVQSLQNKIII